MTEPEFDRDGYPTEATLQALRDWPVSEANGALDFMAAAWHWSKSGVSRKLSSSEVKIVNAEPGDRFLRFATGGWSGNEELLAAFEGTINWTLTWCLSARGGLHIFRYLPENKNDGTRYGPSQSNQAASSNDVEA
jgi:hypothetical protein